MVMRIAGCGLRDTLLGMRILWSAVAVLCAGCCSLRAADAIEEKAVVAAVQTLFDGMSAHDGAKIRSVMTADARLTRIRGDQPAVTVPLEQFLKGIESSQARILERMWDPKVLLRGRLAAVWAEYDFHADGKFTHCGIDSFLLVKAADAWKITTIAYTMETEGCAPSPLGPPK
jgi:hypothetical protein